jgi:hypothetical protein
MNECRMNESRTPFQPTFKTKHVIFWLFQQADENKTKNVGYFESPEMAKET